VEGSNLVKDKAITVIKPAFGSEENKAKLEFRRERALHHLEAVCEKFQTAGALCTSNFRIGIPHDEILNEAAVMAQELIVVGSTATAVFTRFLLGSTAERVVPTLPVRFS